MGYGGGGSSSSSSSSRVATIPSPDHGYYKNGCHSMDPRDSSNLQSAGALLADVCECSSKWSFTTRVTDIGGRPSGPFGVDEVTLDVFVGPLD